MNARKYRGSIEAERNLAPISALPLKCLMVKKLTGSGRVAAGILVALHEARANSNKPALSSWPLATSKSNGNSKDKGNGKTFATDPRPPGQVALICADPR